MALLAAAVLLVLSLTACAETSWSKGNLWGETKPDPRRPAKVVDLWTDSVLHQAGQPGLRGFGGRLMFYGEGEEETCVVDGKLTVLVFDDEKEGTTPEKVYVFLPEQLDRHYSKSELGHSYSFWIPWDDVGGAARRLTLVTRFEDASGHVLTGKPVQKQLPGTGKPAESLAAASPSRQRASDPEVRLASHAAPVDSPPNADSGEDVPEGACKVRSFTIDLPAPQAARWLGDPAEEDRASVSQPAAEIAAGNSAPDAATPAEDVKSSTAEPPTRCAPDSRPAQTGAATAPDSARVRRQPLPGRWLRGLPPTPRYDWARPPAATTPAAASTAHRLGTSQAE